MGVKRGFAKALGILAVLLCGVAFNFSVATANSSINSASNTTTTSTETLGTSQINAGMLYVNDDLYLCNCSVYFIPTVYPSLQAMAALCQVWLANVTAALPVSVKGVPFMVYNITDLQSLGPAMNVPAGTTASLASIGGTANGTTMTEEGYPILSVGSTYIVFLSLATPDALNPYWQYLPYPIDQAGSIFPGSGPYATLGGPQGLFYVKDGNVYSLDNLYPKDDSWLQVKTDGLPLSLFEEELTTGVTFVVSYSTSTTTTTTTPTITVTSHVVKIGELSEQEFVALVVVPPAAAAVLVAVVAISRRRSAV